jgi:hypothetical protein
VGLVNNPIKIVGKRERELVVLAFVVVFVVCLI